MSLFSAELNFALELLRPAQRIGEQVRRALPSGPEAVAKADTSPVTLADLAIQAWVARGLAARFPADPLVGEEDTEVFAGEEGARLLDQVTQVLQAEIPDFTAAETRTAIAGGGHGGGATGRFWTLDPIDGTKGFLRGDQYAVALALVVDGTVQLGLLGCPNLWTSRERGRGCLFAAVRGQGAWVYESGADQPQPVHVSDLGPARANGLLLAESFESGHSSHHHAAHICERIGLLNPPLRLDSQAKYGVVARGEAGLYLRLPTRAGYEEKIWDHAAGVLLVEEAGGRVTDVDGRPLDFSRGRTLSANRGVIASNGRIHEAVLTAARDVLAQK
jgi:3'(2'), 5'-bisphosphate nucleotidase